MPNEIERDPRANRLLAALPKADYERIGGDLEFVPLEPGTVLYRAGQEPGYAYFPTAGVVSILSTMENGALAELAITGNDGVVGIALFMGGATTTSDAKVQVPGSAFRLSSAVLRREFSRGGEFHHLLLRYAQALFTQMAQTAACNRHHSLEKQLCRWLLLRLDLLSTSEVPGTHDAIASLLGVRRSGISEAARRLRAAGLITYTRGSTEVLDRSKLEACACECYVVVKTEVDRLFSTR
ncbi:MAG TPA: Crp/Fnr family transcriptional regulator [Burkholderiales bacterium]|nr:Crp/Fnr family transcriptional regulator [Burkholderiales bacterium]